MYILQRYGRITEICVLYLCERVTQEYKSCHFIGVWCLYKRCCSCVVMLHGFGPDTGVYS